MAKRSAKKQIEKRNVTEHKVLETLGCFLIGFLISPIGWWAFDITHWKKAAMFSLACGIVASVAGVILKPKSFESFITTIIRLLNPPYVARPISILR